WRPRQSCVPLRGTRRASAGSVARTHAAARACEERARRSGEIAAATAPASVQYMNAQQTAATNRDARWAIAMMVIIGLVPSALGKALPSATNKPLTVCD